MTKMCGVAKTPDDY